MVPAENMKRLKTRLIVSKGSETFALKTDDIACIFRNNLIVIVVDKYEKRYVYDKSLTEIESELDPRQFFRANRKYIVNINYVRSYKSFDRVKLELFLSLPNNQHQIIISQETAPHFKKWFQEE